MYPVSWYLGPRYKVKPPFNYSSSMKQTRKFITVRNAVVIVSFLKHV